MMSGEVQKQFYFLFHSFVWGMWMCWVYDGLIVFRRIFRHSRRFIDFEDLMYWFCMTAQIFYLLFTMHRGAIRSYIVVGVIVGNLFYMKTIRSVYQTILYTLLYPIRWLVSKVSTVFKKKPRKLKD